MLFRSGFTIVGDCPLLVEDCSPCSPAGRGGLRAGDYVMEVNGIPVRQHEMAAALIKASQGRTLRLGVLCLGPRQKRSSGSLEENQLGGKGGGGGDGLRVDRKHKALEFNKKVRRRGVEWGEGGEGRFYSPRWGYCNPWSVACRLHTCTWSVVEHGS